MVRESDGERTPLYLTLLAIITVSASFWIIVGNLVSRWLQ